MKISKNFRPRVLVTVLAMLLTASNLNLTNAAEPILAIKTLPDLALSVADEAGPAHLPLATLGVTAGQTARISVVNSPDPKSSVPPDTCLVEMCFHDSKGNLILDRSGRPVQKTVTIGPHHGDFLDLNGNLVTGPGARVVIIPCIRILRISEGTLAVPTVELVINLLKMTTVLSPGTARGFDPQPDPPAIPEVAFGLVGITQGMSARLYVLNAQNPTSTDRLEPITVELEFHDANGIGFVDRSGNKSTRIITLDPGHADFLEINGNDIAALGARVGIIPCVKVLNGSASSLAVPTFEMYANFTQQTVLLNNFVGDPHHPVTPTVR
jgi:hypothetical protein